MAPCSFSSVFSGRAVVSAGLGVGLVGLPQNKEGRWSGPARPPVRGVRACLDARGYTRFAPPWQG
ncbi:hypothetical protein Salmuc_05631 [Salipiger mucosus DSM 16094]|uniref:Uncharacterized protein n=1 Tax=Salipiger mucosus DSM 16094 TaxID=1123237 RepID=S9S0D5_9RHOB|nr:hypothetical protein Salmuc_05631 [Salipiger mucosus DSM 16094]